MYFVISEAVMHLTMTTPSQRPGTPHSHGGASQTLRTFKQVSFGTSHTSQKSQHKTENLIEIAGIDSQANIVSTSNTLIKFLLGLLFKG